jgi:hypothetical protein
MILLTTLLEDYDIIGHLRSRGVDPDKSTVLLDKENGIATFLLYNLSGQLVGYQRYNPRGDKKDHSNSLMAKYYNYVIKLSKDGKGTSAIAVWGLEDIDMSSPYLFVTEGIFDAVKLKNMGISAIAVLSNNPIHLKPWLMALQKKIIAVLDHDDSGSKLKSIADFHITTPEPYKDLGEMPDEEVVKFMTPIIDKFKEGTVDNPKVDYTQTIKNPNTGNDILLKTALQYPKDHPAYRLAQNIVNRSNK